MSTTYTVRMSEEERALLFETARRVKRNPAWILRELISTLEEDMEVTSYEVKPKKTAEQK